MNPSYGINKQTDYDFDTAIDKTTAALKEEGFGVLTEIDVKATLKKKLDVDFRRYTILGACNPPLAHKALSADLGIGLLLPCNVVVSERDGGGTSVSAISPKAMFAVVDDERMAPIVEEVEALLTRAIAAI
ncbi:MAG: DUF302 domain-containing protein [Myxococcales bacterium]|nr:DUF302 domain-containing protein [Myxococcales bacterium]